MKNPGDLEASTNIFLEVSLLILHNYLAKFSYGVDSFKSYSKIRVKLENREQPFSLSVFSEVFRPMRKEAFLTQNLSKSSLANLQEHQAANQIASG